MQNGGPVTDDENSKVEGLIGSDSAAAFGAKPQWKSEGNVLKKDNRKEMNKMESLWVSSEHENKTVEHEE